MNFAAEEVKCLFQCLVPVGILSRIIILKINKKTGSARSNQIIQNKPQCSHTHMHRHVTHEANHYNASYNTTHQLNHSSTPVEERKHWHWDGGKKNSGSATGDWTQGPSFCARVYRATAANYAEQIHPTHHQCQCYTVGWLQCRNLQPTAADTIRCHAVYGLTNNYTRKG